MSELEFCVLNFLVVRPMPLRIFFLEPEEFLVHTNYSMPCESSSSLIEIIRKLMSECLVTSSDEHLASSYLSKQESSFEYENLDSVIESNEMIFLESLGGEHWQTIAKPDWNRFFSANREDDRIELHCTLEQRLAPVAMALLGLEEKRLINRLGLQVRRLSAWQGLYWKSFNKGFGIRIDYSKHTTHLKLEKAPREGFDEGNLDSVFFDVLTWANSFDGQPAHVPNH